MLGKLLRVSTRQSVDGSATEDSLPPLQLGHPVFTGPDIESNVDLPGIATAPGASAVPNPNKGLWCSQDAHAAQPRAHLVPLTKLALLAACPLPPPDLSSSSTPGRRPKEAEADDEDAFLTPRSQGEASVHSCQGDGLGPRARSRTKEVDDARVINGMDKLRLAECFEEDDAPQSDDRWTTDKVSEEMQLAHRFANGCIWSQCSAEFAGLGPDAVLRAMGAFLEVDISMGYKPNVQCGDLLGSDGPSRACWRIRQVGSVSKKLEDNVMEVTMADDLDGPTRSVWVAMDAPPLDKQVIFGGVPMPAVAAGAQRVSDVRTTVRITPRWAGPERGLPAGFRMATTICAKSSATIYTMASNLPSFALRSLMRREARKLTGNFRRHVEETAELAARVRDPSSRASAVYEALRRRLTKEEPCAEPEPHCPGSPQHSAGWQSATSTALPGAAHDVEVRRRGAENRGGMPGSMAMAQTEFHEAGDGELDLEDGRGVTLCEVGTKHQKLFFRRCGVMGVLRVVGFSMTRCLLVATMLLHYPMQMIRAPRKTAST